MVTAIADAPETHDEAHPVLPVRRVRFDFESVPVSWLPEDDLAAQVINVAHVLLPVGERWFAEVLREVLDDIDDELLRREVKAFIGQESVHARSHAGYLATMASAGVPADRLCADLEAFIAGIDRRMTRLIGTTRARKLRVATIAGIEHFTAVLGEWILRTDALDGADPVMLDLLRWHGAEELEHKCVAYDAHVAISGDSYAYRLAGMAIAVFGLAPWWVRVSSHTVASTGAADGRIDGWRKTVRAARANRIPSRRLVTAIGTYLRPGFHPAQHATLGLARRYLATSPAARAAGGAG